MVTTWRWTSRRWLRVLCVVIACLWPSPVHAQSEPELARAKEYFRAGAQAYAVGEFDAAVQAFEQAYALAPRPAVLFSIAQAERRQYFLDKKPEHLERAVEMYRRYLDEDPQASRKVDAVQALSELEPLLRSTVNEQDPLRPQDQHRVALPTRLMISSATPGARIVFDKERPSPSPMVREVEPGEHRILVYAPGFVPHQRTLLAVKGALVALDVALEERPAKLKVIAADGAELRVDGRYQGECPFPRPIELAAGRHLITVTKPGYVGTSREQTLVRGETTVVRAPLRRSVQRTAALIMFGVSGSALVTGGVLTYFALQQQSAAQSFLDERGRRELTAGDLELYESTREDRDVLSVAAGVTYGAAAILGLGGALFFMLDEGSVAGSPEPGRDKGVGSSRGLPLRAAPYVGLGEAGVALGGTF